MTGIITALRNCISYTIIELMSTTCTVQIILQEVYIGLLQPQRLVYTFQRLNSRYPPWPSHAHN